MDSFLTIFYHGRDLAVVFSLYFITDEIWQCQISSEISDDICHLYSNKTDRYHGASYMVKYSCCVILPLLHLHHLDCSVLPHVRPLLHLLFLQLVGLLQCRRLCPSHHCLQSDLWFELVEIRVVLEIRRPRLLGKHFRVLDT